MRLFGCKREREVTTMLQLGHWPDACATELASHIGQCPSCADLVLVQQAFQQAKAETAALPRLESSGAVWWRAQLRRRNEALRRVEKPLIGAHLFAMAVAIVVTAGTAAWSLRQGIPVKDWLASLGSALHLNSLHFDSLHWDALLPAALENNAMWILLPVLATVALLSGVVVYIASEKR